MQAPRIFVAVLSKDGRVALRFATSLLSMQAALAAQGVSMAVAAIDNCTIVGHGRNKLLSQFLPRKQFTHILFIDDDTGWPPEAVPRLLAAREDFIGCTALRKEGPPARWAGNFVEPMALDHRGLLEATGIGACLLLLSRDCVERMVDEHAQLAYKDHDSNDTLYNLFDTELRDGKLTGNDYVFCRRWRDMGGRIWVDPAPLMEHVGTFTWAGSLSQDIEAVPARVPAQAAE